MAKETTAQVAQASDLQDGDLKQVKVGETDVLLARINGQFYATQAICPHYGAPLVKGALHGERLVCPWHHACFNLTSGKLEEPPALEGLTQFKVREENGNLLVSVPAQVEPAAPIPARSTTPTPDPRVFVILGGGAAGYMAAQTLREEAFAGRIVMITREADAPYDRTNLSKGFLAGKDGEDSIPLRDADFYARHEIEVMTEHPVERLDTARRSLTFADGSTLAYNSLLLATGSTPRTLDVPGASLTNVFTLRSYADCQQIIEKVADAKQIVVVGASFIGLEVAASLRTRGLDVTVVAPEKVPFETILGEPVGRMFQDLHQEKGVDFRLEAQVERIEGQEAVEALVLKSGERLAADVVIIGVGVKPATDFQHDLTLHEDGSVPVDTYLAAAEGVFAAGDLAYFPEPIFARPMRVEHWRVAQQHGRIAAHNMLGQRVPYAGVPFFWTQQFGLSLRYVGLPQAWDDFFLWGDPAQRDFIAFYLKNGRFSAAAGLKHDTEMAALEELVRTNRLPGLDALRNQSVDLVGLLKGL